MNIKLTKIVRHKWFPFIVKEIILEIDGEEQPMSIGWSFDMDGTRYSMNVDDYYAKPFFREWSLTKEHLFSLRKEKEWKGTNETKE